MDLIPAAAISQAFLTVFSPGVLLWVLVGSLIGMVFGAAPGLTATAGVAIATPLTFTLGFESAMALLLGIYCAGYFAGSIPAILINTPGAPGNAATAIGGYRMARAGRADLAISLAVVSSFIGGVFSIVVLLTAAPILASFALEFTAAEYFTLGLFGLICVAAVSGGSLVRGAIAATLGMLLGVVGIDPVGGMQRLTFGVPELLSGVPLLPALIAFFAVTEMITQAAEQGKADSLPVRGSTSLGELWRIYGRNKLVALKGALIGTGIGILPGTGPTIASWIAYSEAMRGRETDDAAEPHPAGIISPETANNAVTGGALVPLLTLGIPGDGVTAILIGALLIQGIDPGPLFIVNKPELFSTILLLLLAANIFILVFGLGARRFLPLVLRVPPRILVPTVGVLCATGGFAVSNSTFEVALIALLGVAGYGLYRFGFPMPPLVIGLVLGPIVEVNLRDALTANDMDPTVFVTRPICAVLLGAMVLTIALSWRRAARAKRERRAAR